jgi:hypothetical protein
MELNHMQRRISQAGRELAIAISFGIAGVGIAELALGLIGKGLGSLSAGLESGAVFAIVALVTRRLSGLRNSRELMAFTGAACLVLLSITWIAESMLPLAPERVAYRRAPIIAGVSSLIVCLLGYFDWKAWTRITGVALVIAKAACQVLGAAAIGAGIGFLQGATVDSSQPNMIQDGGALLGAVVGGALGIANFWSKLAGPESASGYSSGVTACLVCGLVAAKLAGIQSLLVTPVVALIILLVPRGRTGEMGHIAPLINSPT